MSKIAKQRTVTVKKEKCDKDNAYTTVNLIALEKASCDLNGVAFKLWIFFAKNQQDYNVDMWINNIEEFGIPKGGSYDRAWKELVDKGYLVQNGTKTNFTFYEIPLTTKTELSNESIPTKMVTKEIINSKTELDSHQNGTIIPTKMVGNSHQNGGRIYYNNTSNNTNNNINNSTDDSVILLNKYITDNNITISNSKKDNNINTKKYNSMVEIVTGKNTEVVDRIIKQHINKNNGIINSSIIIGAVTLVNKQYNKTLQIIEEENRVLEFRRKAEEKRQEQKILELMFNDGDESVTFDSDEMRYVRI